MTETILLAPSANGTELLRSLSRFSINKIGFRVMNATELARYAMQLCGIMIPENFLPYKDEASVIFSFIKDIDYFNAASYTDARNLSSALYSIRSLICDNEKESLRKYLDNGEFSEKNDAIYKVYEEYTKLLKMNNRIDRIGFIRKALTEPLSIDADFIILKEYPLTPLETCLINKLSGNNAKETALNVLFERNEKLLEIKSYTEAYGTSNEVENIIGTIFQNNISTDACTVAVSNPAQYSQLFYDISVSHSIPMTFGCGVPIINSNPAKLLKALYHWDTDGYNGTDALKKVIFSEAFDRKKLTELYSSEDQIFLKEQQEILKIAGSLRLSYDAERNSKVIAEYRSTLEPKSNESRWLDYSETLSKELSKGCSYIIKEYSLIRDNLAGRIDRSAVKVICDAIDSFTCFSAESINQIIPEILNQTVCSENSREGNLYITSIEGALSSVRENLFVAGLSASMFPGTPSEDYLILDNDYSRFSISETAPTSINRISLKKKTLINLLTLSSTLNIPIYLSFSDFDLSDLKAQNPSSILFEIFKKESGTNPTIKQFEEKLRRAGFFNNYISSEAIVGKAFADGKKIVYHTPETLAADNITVPDRSFSPTAIETFFKCPCKFYLKTILGIEPNEEDDPFIVIPPSDRGKLAHSLMEWAANNKPDKLKFIDKASEVFDIYLKSRPPMHTDLAQKEKDDFIYMMKNAYDIDPKNEVISAEKDRTVIHPSGVMLHGIPDRVEKTPEGEYIIADYKTGRKIIHKTNDIDTCIQTVLYAYMIEDTGITISRCEYRYLWNKDIIVCKYDDDIRKQLNDKLAIFKAALDSTNFPCPKNCDPYCDFIDICGKDNHVKEDME